MGSVVEVFGLLRFACVEPEGREEGGWQNSSKRSAWWEEWKWMYVCEESLDMIVDCGVCGD